MIINEKIKASEVWLTGVEGEDLGIIKTTEALAMAKRLKVDLVCTSLASSPPPCRLIGKGAAKQEAQMARKRELPAKIKEIRLTPQIEDHDYETKCRQAEHHLASGDAVMLVVAVRGKEEVQAKELLQQLIQNLKPVGRPKTGIQLSGKQATVQLEPF